MQLKPFAIFLSQAGKYLIRFLGWVSALVLFLINIYQFYDSLALEKKLDQAEERINSAQIELQKAQLYLDKMENELKDFEDRDEDVNEEIEGLIKEWRVGLMEFQLAVSEE